MVNFASLAGADSGPTSFELSAIFERLPDSTEPVVLDRTDKVTLLAKLDSNSPQFWIELPDGGRKSQYGWSPVLAADGSVIFVDSEDLSLKKLLINGDEQQLLPPGSAAGFLRISSDRKYLGYAIPINLSPGSNWVGLYGAGIMDLETGKVLVSRTKENFFTSPIGWYGDQLIVHEWDATQTQDSLDLYALSLDGELTKFALGLPQANSYPEISPDHQWLVYADTHGDAILLRLADGSFGTVPNVEFPSWTQNGLTGLVDGRRVLIKITSQP
ncbi:hypothetical protein [Symbiobacterium thermophilum]|uniref:Uncharacterized protein n=2 Tax=Symbiobacterium thermophilum TaxID=2734 RepID=Q67QC4_SYMTH|nr:hypothetical protein [Symbiobacterium thermophilum]BAD40119.1 hypothetical protein STH1134 [Symbiobacterium thermophilum IAM 14863]